MGRLPLDYPSKWRLFARFWLDRVVLPFGGWEKILNGLNVPVSGIPTFYVTIVKQYYRFRCGVTSCPSYREEADAQLLWGNPGIVDRTGKPLGVLTLARASISIVGQLRTRAGFVDTDTLKRRFTLARRGGSLVRVIDSFLRQSSRDVYLNLVHRLYRTPAAIRHWQVYLHRDPPWTQAWKSAAAARLSTAYARDIAFKLLNRVLPTRNRLDRWHLAPSGAFTVCGVPDETLLQCLLDVPTLIMSSILSVHYFDLCRPRYHLFFRC